MPALLLPVVLAGLALALAGTPAAQITLGGDGATLAVSGGLQPRAGFDRQSGAERLGFGLRRARLQARVTVGRLGAEYDAELSTGAIQAIDLFAFADVSDRVQVRAGLLAGAQPRALVPTGYPVIDVVDRAAIAERWATGTIGPLGRDFGVDAVVRGERTRLDLFVHNGSGGGFSASDNVVGIGSGALAEADRLGLAVSAAVRHTLGGPSGVEVGAFAGVSSGNERTATATPDGPVERSYATGSAHAYWGALPGSQPVRLKADALALRYDGPAPETAAGVSLLAAVRALGHGEALARAERYWADVDASGDTYLTAGLSYSLSAARGGPYEAARLTLAYTGREVAGTPAHLVVLQGQFAF